MDNLNKIDGLNVSRETFDKVNAFTEILLKWNKTINLVSKQSIGDDLFNRHIIDSLQLLPFLNNENFTDLGSGAGFPAIIIALANKSEITLIESDKRKVAFLNYIAGKFDLNCKILASRVEKTKINTDIITSRAFASIERTFELIDGSNHIESKKLFLLKGESYFQEIEKAQEKWLFDYEKIDSITDDKSKIIVISNITSK